MIRKFIGVAVLVLLAGCQAATTATDQAGTAPPITVSHFAPAPAALCTELQKLGPDGGDSTVISVVNGSLSGLTDAQLTADIHEVVGSCPAYASLYQYEQLRRASRPSGQASAPVAAAAGSPSTARVAQPTGSQPPITDPNAVNYSITGTAKFAVITYMTKDGLATSKSTKLPWKFTVTIDQSTIPMLYLSAQATGNGTVTCVIRVAGKRVASDPGGGQDKTSTCERPSS